MAGLVPGVQPVGRNSKAYCAVVPTPGEGAGFSTLERLHIHDRMIGFGSAAG
jgi:hypothetical protein